MRSLVAGVYCIFVLSHEIPKGNASQILRVTTRLVQVHIVALNKQGGLVRGLTRNDFTILDDGRVQEVSVFSTESGKITLKPANSQPHNVFSNRMARR